MRRVILFSLLVFAVSALATPFWDAETHREGRRRIEQLQSQSSLRPAEMPPWEEYPRFSYPHELVELCAFWDFWQLLDTDSSEHGGIIEAESGELRDVIQTDNTQEVVWDWAFYTSRSGDSTYLPSIDSAWVYLSNFPAYLEEVSDLGGGYYTYYYRVWNSALGLLMCKGLREFVGGDYTGYEGSCWQVIRDHRLPLDTPWPEINGLHALVSAFAAGALFQWSMDCTCIEQPDTAMSIATDVQEWIDRDTAAHMAYIDWAMSGGTILWGLLNSVFTAMPESLEPWLAVYGPYIPDGAPIPDTYDAMIWDNSWNIWFANGFRALWAATGDTVWFGKYRRILDNLLAQDRDGDGGIPVSLRGPDNEDMTWISAYLLLYAMDWVIDSLPALDVGALNPEVVMPMGFATSDDTVAVIAKAANFGNSAISGAHFTIYKDWGVLVDTTVDLKWGEAFPAETLWTTPGAEGAHVVEVHTYFADANPWNDTARVEIDATPVREVTGSVSDREDLSPIEAEIHFSLIWEDSLLPFDTAISGIDGNYSIDLPCLSYKVNIEPEFPYWGVDIDSFGIDPFIDNILNFELNRADLLLVDDDLGRPYENYFKSSLDSIGITFRVWDRNADGNIAPEVSGELRRHTVLWFTGDDTASTLDSADLYALDYIIRVAGGNVLLTGQGICNDLSGTASFDSLVGCIWLGGVGGPILSGVDGDTISGGFRDIVTFGMSDGAGNQTNRDRLAPIDPAVGFLTYSDGAFAGVRREDTSSGGKMVFLGFGMEGISHPGASPAYSGRPEVLKAILRWFDPTFDVAEQASVEKPTAFEISAHPNPFNSAITITIDGAAICHSRESGNPEVVMALEIFDLNGRRVAQLSDRGTVGAGFTPALNDVADNNERDGARPSPTTHKFVWTPDETVTSGVYLVRAGIDGKTVSRKVVLLK